MAVLSHDILILSCLIGIVNGKQPNIVFIIADDYGWNDIGYHESDIKTPTLDKIAAGGIRLENYYVQPVCTPTRSALLSGRMPIHTGMHNKLHTSEPVCHPLQDIFLPEVLIDLGYATQMVGKWHVGFYKEQCIPTRRGFNSFFGFYSGQETYFTHLRDGFLDFNSQTTNTPFKAERNFSGEYSTHVFVQRAQDVIRKHQSIPSHKPLFLYLSFQSVHVPNEVPDIYERQYRNVVDPKRWKYSAMVSCMDEAIRNVTQTLKDCHIWENTIIIFSSDNGGAFGTGASNWPLRGGKGSLFEGGIRANAFIHSPLLNRSNILSHDLFHVTDWLPTIVEAAGGDTRDMDIDGVSQWETLRAGAQSERNEILHDIDTLSPMKGSNSYSDIFDTRIRAAIRVGEWKLITGNTGVLRWSSKPESNKTIGAVSNALYSQKNLWLFNLKQDPREENDISSMYPDVLQRMLHRLKHFKAETLHVTWPKKDPRGTPAPGSVWKPWVTDNTQSNRNALIDPNETKITSNIESQNEEKDEVEQSENATTKSKLKVNLRNKKPGEFSPSALMKTASNDKKKELLGTADDTRDEVTLLSKPHAAGGETVINEFWRFDEFYLASVVFCSIVLGFVVLLRLFKKITRL